ncbi:4761_t:CDS:2 [Ambispora leptoticha]|uniref:4761_t:CDS:1 n=1 Tax=Ambispora leptoticha TaxID=144679 RepID=A0A9N8ZNT9_9GLOM|nr:4761_t:CDS:2 [Ambispora leptoticha]
MSLRKKIPFDPPLDDVTNTTGRDSKKYRTESSSGETWTWDYQSKYTNWRNWIPRREIMFTLEELSKYDGSDPDLPIYLAINGEVFDVTQGRDYYGKGGSYGFFSGRDASRAYITGCFSSPSHLSHDLRGLTPDQLKSLEGWASFYRDHHTYFKVGRVALPPIDPNSPIPPPCNDPTEQKSS